MKPTLAPSTEPTLAPSTNPTASPTENPTVKPTESLTKNPTTASPTKKPTIAQSAKPTLVPSTNPTAGVRLLNQNLSRMLLTKTINSRVRAMVARNGFKLIVYATQAGGCAIPIGAVTSRKEL
ncbi:hypothetical protein HJC23_008912 [Cyclotella cryptica]|uniref:Uncharacterized protein n=1 Tax=Cyclotella cryptica TaxID=29204 RepID=A0ABD3Q2B8_9STRA